MFVRYRTPLMNAEGTAPAGGAPPVAAPVAPAVSAAPVVAPTLAAPSPGEEFKAMTTEQFNARLSKERELGTKAFMKDLGFEKLDDAKAYFAEAKKRADAEKTEAQKTAEKLAALEPKAKQAEVYEGTIKRYLEAEEKAIPEDKRGLLDLAPPVTSPEARLDWIATAKAKGLFAAAAVAPSIPKPATTIAQPGPSVPPPAGQKTAFEQYTHWKSVDPVLAAQHYARNSKAIEASRPK